MILAIDPGYARCGWAIVEPNTGRFVALGVIVTTADPGVKRKTVKSSTDRARRIATIARELTALAIVHGATTLAVEQMLCFGAAAAVAANQLPWGVVVGIATVLGLSLLELTAKHWQTRIVGVAASKSKRDYKAIKAKLKEYAGEQIVHALVDVETEDETHALDAGGVGLVAAIEPHAAETIIRRPLVATEGKAA